MTSGNICLAITALAFIAASVILAISGVMYWGWVTFAGFLTAINIETNE